MNFLTILKKKRDGLKLSSEEIRFFIDGILQKTIPEYQTSAFLMSIFYSGLDFEETIELTNCMINSGKHITLPDSLNPSCDKHSTGGVGDKISIPLAPIVSSCGVTVGMMSGRALGHTGGTLDKLESIPGFNVNLSVSQFINQLKMIGVSMIGQTSEIAPADKILYAMRDATSTVESIPLISASIMSKKIAEGTQNLLIDLKLGKGAFIKKIEDARKLANYMIEIGKHYKLKTEVVITKMDEPIGDFIGNANEIIESIELLKNNKVNSHFYTLTLDFAARMIVLAKNSTFPHALNEVKNTLINGSALNKFKELLKAQLGNPAIIDDYSLFFKPKATKTYFLNDIIKYTSCNGKNYEMLYIGDIDAYKAGIASMHLGAGRFIKEDKVDHSAGITIHKHVGDIIKPDEPFFEMYGADSARLNAAFDIMKDAFTLTPNPPKQSDFIIETIV